MAVAIEPIPWTPLAEELRPVTSAWEVACRFADWPRLLFLDSALAGGNLGRYSFVAADPFGWLTSRGHEVRLDGRLVPAEDPFPVLAEQLGRFHQMAIPGLPPFQGGIAGLFGYDLCHHLERLPRPVVDEFRVPDLALGFYDWVIACDHATDQAWILSTGFPELDPTRRRHRARTRLEQVRRRLSGPASSLSPTRQQGHAISPVHYHPMPGIEALGSSFTREGFLQAIRQGIDYVHAGDCFQVNLAQRLLSPHHGSTLELYGRSRTRNPAPYAGYFDLGDFVLASASPEQFVGFRQGVVGTRPIKGTRPRGATPEEDRARAGELLSSPKDRAENVMIVDLLRNDLGRVCRYGSIQVASLCHLESYRTVHHLVSEVLGRLREGLGPVDILRAAFPGGSVTGAPKVRAMEIIAELEPVSRGAYCGSLGYLGFDGSMDTNILIRTFTVGKGWIQFPVGGGIVADSDPGSEYAETLHKAAGLLRALG